MARGKQSALAAARRADAAHEHIDRLTDQLVEAKARARRHETAAERLPMLETEVARLRRQTAEGSSDALERERDRHAATRAALEDRLLRLGQLLLKMMNRADARMTREEWTELIELTGQPVTVLDPGTFNSRNHRRNTATPERIRKHSALWRQI